METQRGHATNIPPAVLNGGLYTGEPFLQGAPWRNFPAIPDSGYMMSVPLMSANPPAQAVYHVPGGGLRPGNYTPVLPVDFVGGRRIPGLNTVCVPDAAAVRGPDVMHANHGFSGFRYLE